MDAGRIAERGTHHELLERNGHYAKMWAGAVGRSDANIALDGGRSIPHPRHNWREG
jgi:hypothetical protein